MHYRCRNDDGYGHVNPAVCYCVVYCGKEVQPLAQETTAVVPDCHTVQPAAQPDRHRSRYCRLQTHHRTQRHLSGLIVRGSDDSGF